ncbi:FunK1 protein kinase [Nannizzia gypsea CBS 118893]|uniref:non-specific serine/threonine protein kinase n=1 Tax=Arthroderma gypseum (strain ATCC MYA-4604 / CBS 118893) TaxID=535722 RepID=E4US89_ARTGP|nr:FunK1 protein kinase [Nannizzia gypsea CBS 118893]EFR01293.1 FunK1 protein kinase [Nannizzia gypsea CBS 118893]
MTSLSEDDRRTIKDCPLNDSLKQLRKSLLEVESLDGTDGLPELIYQKAVSRLLYTLLGTEAALVLQSRTSSRDVASEMVRLVERVRNGDFSYTHYRPLVKLIIQEASDFDIWSAVLDLINKSSRETPSASVPPTFDGTPITHSSASQQGGEQTRRLVEARVFEEIRGCTYRNVQGFFEKYFEGKHWTDRARDVYSSVKDQYVNREWASLRNSPSQDQVLSWLFRLQDNFLSKERCHYYTINIPKELSGGEARRQVDLIVKRKSGKQSDTAHDWRDIWVIGELKASNNDGVKKTLVQLARYVRDVFACQPTRRYLHAFTICGSSMTTWVFDRSGCYSPGKFNIHEQPERFIQVVAGYTMMNEEDLGLDTFTEHDDDRRFIYIGQEGTEMKLQMEPQFLTRQRAIVCRGTSCYLTKFPDSNDWDHVAKFSWTSDRRKPEADLLTLANQRGVKGIVRLVGHRPITTIKEMRSGMIFTKPYSFRGTPSTPSSCSQSFSQPPSVSSRSVSDFHSLTIAESSAERPKKRKSIHTGPISKRSKPNSQQSAPQDEVSYDVEEAQGTSLLAPSNSPYDNRIFRCLVIFPAGRPIHKYKSLLELLEALRDAIKAHRSLYFEGKILHRDISENNIIITDSKKTGFAGMLIDMDLAKEIGTERSGARYRTGTMEFMAIEVLLNTDHTYRHDLESFFYVFLYQCGRRGWEYVNRLKNQPSDTRAKRGNMDANGFEDILREFPPELDSVKPLCKELRSLLFPIRGGAIFTGTPKDPEILYGPIINAFDKAIGGIKGKE